MQGVLLSGGPGGACRSGPLPAPGRLTEGGQHGGLTRKFVAGGTLGPHRAQRGLQPAGLGPGVIVDGLDGLAAEQHLRRVRVEPLVLLVGHHMSFCVHGRECVTPAGATAP